MVRAPQTRVYLSLGSNLGDRRANLKRALRKLVQTPGLTISSASRVYRSAPVEVTDQPEFLNLAAEARTSLAPCDLLHVVKRIERELGRPERSGRWGPRVIDIDLLLYDGVQMETPELTLPHPRMWGRGFVLAPLAEIAPQLTMPDGRRVTDIAEAMAQEQDVSADL